MRVAVSGSAPTTINAGVWLANRSQTLTAMYIRNFIGPVTTGVTAVFTLLLNSADTVLTITLNPGDSSGSITGQSVAITEGDTLQIRIVNSGSPTGAAGGGTYVMATI